MSGTTFPRHDINPKDKGKEWLLQYAKAIFSEHEGSPSKMFARNKEQYEIIKTYVLGRQNTDKYKLLLLGAEDCKNEDSLLAIDWTTRPVLMKIRNIAITKILDRGYNIVCTPIDPLAKTEEENYYNELRVKILMREAALQANPELANNPAFTKEYGEPEDLEELEMSMDSGPKIKLAMESELGVQLVLYKNDFDEVRRQYIESLFDYGVAGLDESVDDNSDIVVRACDPANIVMSHCSKPDFTDKTHCGEIIEVRLSQLANKFNKEELEEISKTARNKEIYLRTPSKYNEEFDAFKVNVLSFRIYSYNDTVFQQRVDSRGNFKVFKEGYKSRGETKGKTITHEGKTYQQYERKTKEVVYSGKWIIGTDYIYDYGLVEDKARMKPNKAVTDMGYHFNAYNFHNGESLSVVESVIPIIDEYQMTVYKIQQFKNKWIPYIMDIDLDALETVALGKGGKNLTKKQLIEMVYQNFTLVSKRGDRDNPNYKSVDIRTTGMHQEYSVLVNDLGRLLAEMRDMMGLNEITDGSSPNPNLLNYVASLGAEATNNALAPLMRSDKKLVEAVSKGIIQRLVKLVKKKKIEGILPALGTESVRFFSLTPDICLHDWGIMVEDKPTAQERQILLQQLASKDAQGQIDPQDFFIIMTTQNLKQAWKLLAYRVKKKQKEAQQYELQKMQMNGQVQQQSAMVAEQSKQATLQKEFELKAALETQMKQWDEKLLKQKIEGEITVKQMEISGKKDVQAIANEGKQQGGKNAQE